MNLFRKPTPRLTDAEKAASAASYLSRYAARKRKDAAKDRQRSVTRALEQFVADGNTLGLGWRA